MLGFADVVATVGKSLMFLSVAQRRTYFSLIWVRVFVNLLDLMSLSFVTLFAVLVGSRISGRSQVTWRNITLSLDEERTYFLLLLGIGITFLLKSSLATLTLRWNLLKLAEVETQVASEIARHKFGGDLGRIKNESFEKVGWTLSASTSVAFTQLLTNFHVLLTELSLFLFIFAFFLVIDFQATLFVTLYFLAFIGLFQVLINPRLARAGELLDDTSKQVSRTMLDLFRAFKELAVYSRINDYIAQFVASRSIAARTHARIRFFDGSPRYFAEAGLMIGVLSLVAWQFFMGELVEGLVVISVFLAGGMRMMGALLPMQNAIGWMKVSAPQASDSHQALELARSDYSESPVGAKTWEGRLLEQTSGSPNAVGSSAGGAEVKIEGLSFYYEYESKPAITNLSLTIKPGTIHAFVGPSGAGKSTIADVMLGLLAPTRGTVGIDGNPPELLVSKSPGEIAYVPQRPGMVSGTLAENVALGGRGTISKERVTEVLRAVGLLAEIQKRGGIDSSIGAHADALSGGQLQRLGIARALYTEPRLIVLDEATSALDAGAEAEVMNCVKRLRGSVTVVVIAHRLSTVQDADMVTVIEDGRAIATGDFSQVVREVPFLRDYVNLMKIAD